MKRAVMIALATFVLSVFAVSFASAYGYHDHYENKDVEKYYKKSTNYNYFPGGYEKVTSKFTTTSKRYSAPAYYFPRSHKSYSYIQSNYGYRYQPSFSRYSYPRERYYDNYYYKPIRTSSGSYYWRY